MNGWEKLGGIGQSKKVSFESGFKELERVQMSEGRELQSWGPAKGEWRRI